MTEHAPMAPGSVPATERHSAPGSAAQPEQGGCWIAYYADRSAVSVFGTEIDALRHAVERSMLVRFQPWGEVEFK